MKNVLFLFLSKNVKPDYDDINDEDTKIKSFKGKSDKGKDLNKKYGKYSDILYIISLYYKIESSFLLTQ